MAIQKISIEACLSAMGQWPLFDVRSPAEYGHAHIPGALLLPIFSNEERKIIGTAYKQEGREIAIKLGLDFFGPNMRKLVTEVEAVCNENALNALGNERPIVCVYCWRGGMRSDAMAWLLNLYGFRVLQITGGYKSYRRWALASFEKDRPLQILGGYTGSGKTEILHQLQQHGSSIIDLEALARHRGSAFGNLDRKKQPSQEMFENLLALALYKADQTNESCWLEDESQRIGNLLIPNAFWKIMRQKPLTFLDIPFEKRLEHIVKHYAAFSEESISEAILRIKKRLGPLETKTALICLAAHDIAQCFHILLQYYDKMYSKALLARESDGTPLVKIHSEVVDEKINAEKIGTKPILQR